MNKSFKDYVSYNYFNSGSMGSIDPGLKPKTFILCILKHSKMLQSIQKHTKLSISCKYHQPLSFSD